MLIAGPPLCPPWVFFSCCSKRSSWKTREFFSVPRASTIVCFWISVSVSWWSRFSSSVWLLLSVLLVNCKRKFIRHYYSVVLIDTKQMFPKFWSGKETPQFFCITLRYWPGSWVFGFHLLCLWFDSAEWFWLDGALPQGTEAPIGTKIKLVKTTACAQLLSFLAYYYYSNSLLPVCSAPPQPLPPALLCSVRSAAPVTAPAAPSTSLPLPAPDSPNPVSKNSTSTELLASLASK